MAMAAEDEYYVSTGEGTSQSRAEAWRIGFGLQAADGLTPSDYAVSQAREQIDGRVSYAEVEHNLREYHEGNKSEEPHFEADIVSTRISAILQDDSFVLMPPMLRQIHRHLFQGVFRNDWVGVWRTVNISKREPVLGGDSVSYAPYHLVGETLDYDFMEERKRGESYPGASRRDIASSVFGFISGIWQIHPFREGNTRTTAVFAIMYLRRLGFTVDNTPFASHAQYFRDALVLDNTFDSDLKDPVPLQRFMEATLFDPSTPLPPLRHPNGVTESEPGSPAQSQAPLPDPSPEPPSATALGSDSYHGPSL